MVTTLRVRDLRVACLIGCLEEERQRTQQLRVDLELTLDASRAARQDRLEHTLDYGALSAELTWILQQGRFYLLEAAARMALRYVLAPTHGGRPRPIQARLTLSKFGVLPGDAVPSIEVHARADELEYAREDKPWGTVDVIGETRLLGLYRLNVAGHREIPTHVHRVMHESELILSPTLQGWRDGEAPRPLAVGERFDWRHDQPHGYRNVADAPGAILCVDRPPFLPHDEVTV
jgi:dihydroneopterin aldolase